MLRQIVRKAKLYSSVSALYALTLFFAFQTFDIRVFYFNAPAAPLVHAQAPIPQPERPELKIISAKPIRIVIPDLGIDLPISDGAYDAASKSWTLSDNHVHYALPSTMPNDYTGNTLIYGHKYDWVFGVLPDLRPGDTMQLYGDGGQIFTYIYRDTQKLSPEDNSVFRYSGPPTVSLQTCSGRWNEIRQMFNFTLQGVS